MRNNGFNNEAKQQEYEVGIMIKESIFWYREIAASPKKALEAVLKKRSLQNKEVIDIKELGTKLPKYAQCNAKVKKLSGLRRTVHYYNFRIMTPAEAIEARYLDKLLGI